MNKWIVTLNNETSEFCNFQNALAYFLNEIKNHFLDHVYMVTKESKKIIVFNSSCLPESFVSIINYLYDSRTITDEEIVLESRLAMLLSHFVSCSLIQIKDNALKTIKKSYEYHYDNEELKYQMDIKIDYSINEITTDINLNHGESYLCSNAFIFDNDKKQYFFKSHQTCITSEKISNVGKTIDLDIRLEKYKER